MHVLSVPPKFRAVALFQNPDFFQVKSLSTRLLNNDFMYNKDSRLKIFYVACNKNEIQFSRTSRKIKIRKITQSVLLSKVVSGHMAPPYHYGWFGHDLSFIGKISIFDIFIYYEPKMQHTYGAFQDWSKHRPF